jgi:hypothetical protein
MGSIVLSAPLVDVSSLVKVLVASLLGGAGLVAIFALGLAGVSAYVGNTEGGAAVAPGRKPAGLMVALTSFAVVIAGVAYGISVLLNSK